MDFKNGREMVIGNDNLRTPENPFLHKSNEKTTNNYLNQLYQNSRNQPKACSILGCVYSRKWLNFGKNSDIWDTTFSFSNPPPVSYTVLIQVEHLYSKSKIQILLSTYKALSVKIPHWPHETGDSQNRKRVNTLYKIIFRLSVIGVY